MSARVAVTDPDRGPGRDPGSPPDPFELVRSRAYLRLLVMAALVGVPISAFAYFYLQLVSHIQSWAYTDLPHGLGFSTPPMWWPIPLLVIAGVLVAMTIRYLPGRGGESPADGFKAAGPPMPIALVGIAVASIASIGLGAVVGPEAPLIALGAGLGAGAVRAINRNAPAQAVALMGAVGSFAAISTLLGSPLLGAFLLMEAAGLGGSMVSLVLLPGLLSAGIGTLVFIGLDSMTGLGTASLSIPDIPHFSTPDVAEFGWALVIGVAGALVGTGIRRAALALKVHVEARVLVLVPLSGLVVAGLAIAYAEATDKPSSDVLFSGQSALGPLIANADTYSVGALLMLLLCKSLAYSVSLSGFRGGPIFPAMFIGAAGGIALSHLPGLPMVAGVSMGIGAMCVAMLRLPLVSVLLATVLLAADGLALMPLAIVAVATSFVLSAHLAPRNAAPPAQSRTVRPD